MSRPSILIIESSAAVRERLRASLADCNCVFAASASEALQHVNVRAFDAYVLDYFMPDWSGPLLCREIRKHDPNSPVILCTEAGRTCPRRAACAGPSAYVEKPVDADLLGSKLRLLLRFAESESLRAAKQAKRVVHDELLTRGVTETTRSDATRALALLGATALSIERTARTRAHKTFIDAGGTRARFDRWWAMDCQALFPRTPDPRL